MRLPDEASRGDPEGMMNGAEDPSPDMTSDLLEKYRRALIEKLTKKDLEELQFFVRNQVRNQQIDPEYRQKLEWKLRQYFHEEVLRREFASIEALIARLRPEDLNE